MADVNPQPNTAPDINASTPSDTAPPVTVGFSQSEPGPTAPPKESLLQGIARGAGGEQYFVDAQGNVTNARTTAPSGKGMFGNILASAVMGALAGASKARPGGIPSHEVSGGVGAGAAAGMEFLKNRDERNRGIAQQNFKNNIEATKAMDESTRTRAEVELANLRAIREAHDIAQAKLEDPIRYQNLVDAHTQNQLVLQQQADALGYSNPREYLDYVDVPQADRDKFMRGEVKLVPLPPTADGHHGVRAYDIAPSNQLNPVDYEIKQSHYDPKTDKIVEETVGHVKAGQGTQGDHRKAVEQENNSRLEAYKAQADAKKESAQTDLAKSEAAKNYSTAQMNNFMASGKGDVLLDAAYNLKLDPTKITSMKNNQREAFAAALQTKYPDFNWGAYNNSWETIKKFTEGDIGKNLANFGTAIEHLDQLSQVYTLLQQRGDTGVQEANKILRNLGFQVTDNNPMAQLGPVREALAGELGRAYTGMAAGVEETQNLKKNFSEGLQKGNAQAAIRATLLTLKSRENSLRGQFVNGITAKWLPDEKRQPEAYGINLLGSPEARNIMTKWGLGGTPSTPNLPPDYRQLGKDSKGNIVGYVDKDGKWVSLQTQRGPVSTGGTQ